MDQIEYAIFFRIEVRMRNFTCVAGEPTVMESDAPPSSPLREVVRCAQPILPTPHYPLFQSTH